MTASLPLTFRLGRNWLYLVTTTLLSILVFQFMGIRDSAGRSEFAPLLRGDVGGYLTKLLYYFPLELVTTGVMLIVLTMYRSWLRLYSLAPCVLSLIKYQLVYLPAILIGIGLVCPVTNTLRYLILYSADYGWLYYFPQYCFTWTMYGKYLLPVLLFSYVFLNANLVLDYMSWQRRVAFGLLPIRSFKAPLARPKSGHQSREDTRAERQPEPVVSQPVSEQTPVAYLKAIDAFDKQGQTLLPLDQVHYFEVRGKTYLAHAAGKVYTIHRTFTQLVLELDPQQFLRISRGVIVNVGCVSNYSYWKYDKFIVRLKNSSDEFVMQRSHLKALKALLADRP